MGVAVILLATAIGGAAVPTEGVARFPGAYFDSRVREPLHREVMASWPGPSALLELWRSGELDEEARVSLLVGGAAFHDPLLLPAYREGVASPSARVRQAAAYGYRDLIADRRPDVRAGVDDRASALLAEEIGLVELTLRSRPLIQLWLQSALAQEGRGFEEWPGITLQRPVGDCLLAVERLVGPEDLELLLGAMRLSREPAVRINLLKLVEAVSLSRFIVKPKGDKQGWGSHVYDQAFAALEGSISRWAAGGCTVDGERVLRSNLEAMGASGVDPLAPEGCGLWLGVLEQGEPRWWMLAARRLYACGGPLVELSALNPDGESDRELRKRLLEWFKPLRPEAAPARARR